MGRTVYLPTGMVDFYGNCREYFNPMHAMTIHSFISKLGELCQSLKRNMKKNDSHRGISYEFICIQIYTAYTRTLAHSSHVKCETGDIASGVAGHESTIHSIHIFVSNIIYRCIHARKREKVGFTCTTYVAHRPRMPVASEGCSKFFFGKHKHVIFLFTMAY